MPLKQYGVLKGRLKAMRAALPNQSHYHLWLNACERDYRASVNVRSMLHPSEVEYFIDLRLSHPVTRGLSRLPAGFHPLESHEDGLAIDYIRLNLVDRDTFLTLPCDGPLCGADLNEVLDGVLLSALADPDAWIYVFGEPWEANATDRVFRFFPSRGMHEVHMNQGNDPSHWRQDGVWQDGAVLIEHPGGNRWKGVFLKFQSQSWHTDDETGHPLAPPKSFGGAWSEIPLDRNGQPRPDGMVRMIAAMVSPSSAARGPERHESITLLNACPYPVDLTGWNLLNGQKKRHRLKGTLEAGETREIPLGASFPLGNDGNIVTLLNNLGMKVHGVSYTAEQASREGWRIVF